MSVAWQAAVANYLLCLHLFKHFVQMFEETSF